MDTACMHRSPHPSLFAEERLARLGLGMRLILIDIELRLIPFTCILNTINTCRQNMFHGTLKKLLGQLQLNHHTWPSYVRIWHHFY